MDREKNKRNQRRNYNKINLLFITITKKAKSRIS